jgi:EAL domain-containing protein (putative c-di-GMP-specific phosphodiesterase class I)/GGDEF domain-containing protein
VKILSTLSDPATRDAVNEAAQMLGAEVIEVAGENGGDVPLLDALRSRPDILVTEVGSGERMERLRRESRARGIALVGVAASGDEADAVVEIGVDEWVMAPSSAPELAGRLRCAVGRARAREAPAEADDVAQHLRYEELLYDRFTGFPTLPVMMERGRKMLERTGSLTVVYVEFVRYSKLEEIYGWQKLDEVLQSTANAVREFYTAENEEEESLLMVSHTGDDDFILFTTIGDPVDGSEQRLNEIAQRLEHHIHERLEREHGEEIAGLFGIYIGATTLYRNPKLRTERMIYRAIREAGQVARSVEQRERTRKIVDLKETLREGAVYIEYHPIVVSETAEVYGYEALARGVNRALRSPEVMFGVAEEANLIWELSRLCRRRAIEGIADNLEPDHLLFLNIDPHDFRDPKFRYMDVDELGIENPERIVLEITERTAITDYPKFQKYLADFRERGFRFAVDDAGSGYAGLGSIANLAPDYIKLDISLISSIDSNYMKQNLVETMVDFANDHEIIVIAEGVEREEEWETVKELGVHLTQGFLFHKPRYLNKGET